MEGRFLNKKEELEKEMIEALDADDNTKAFMIVQKIKSLEEEEWLDRILPKLMERKAKEIDEYIHRRTRRDYDRHYRPNNSVEMSGYFKIEEE